MSPCLFVCHWCNFEACKRDRRFRSFDEMTDGYWQCMLPLGLWTAVICKSEDGTLRDLRSLFTCRTWYLGSVRLWSWDKYVQFVLQKWLALAESRQLFFWTPDIPLSSHHYPTKPALLCTWLLWPELRKAHTSSAAALWTIEGSLFVSPTLWKVIPCCHFDDQQAR